MNIKNYTFTTKLKYFIGNYLYRCGKGLRQNYKEESFNLIVKAARLGDVEAEYMSGWLYLNGIGTEQNVNNAFKWFTKAAEQGDVRSKYMIGFCFYYGIGVKQNREEAFKWYTKYSNRESNLNIKYAINNYDKIDMSDLLKLEL